MKLVIMTNSAFFVEEDKILFTLFDEGMEKLHLYKPGASPIYMERLLSLLPSSCYDRITVHDHLYLKNEYNLAGIHFDNVAIDTTRIKGKISKTCYSLDNLAVMKKDFNYVFLNVVSEPKNDQHGLSYNDLQTASKQGLIDKYVYLSGDTTFEHIQLAKEFDFGGIVIQNDLWSKFDIHHHHDFKQLIDYFHKLQRAVG